MKSHILIILFFFPLITYAQGGLIIEGGAQVVVQGSPNLIVNNGKFLNDGTFSAGNSTVILEGTAPTTESTIGGATNTVFNNLTIAKSSNDVRLDYEIQVDGDIEMNGGMLIMNYSDIFLGGDIIGETETNRITGTEGGAIIKTVMLDMPSGENPGNMGAEITSASNLGSTMIRRSHVQRENGDDYSIYRVFDVIPENNFGLNATLRFHYFDEELAGLTEGDLEMWDYDEIDWISLGSDNSNTSENWVEVQGISTFNTMTLAVNMDGALPIELLSFDAVVNEKKEVDLLWVTATEINNDFFTVERSKDGIVFEAIEEVSGAGTTYQARQYSAIDKTPFAGVSYYRIKQTDFDGTFSYSEIKAVNIQLDQTFTVYPNPLKEVLHVVNDGGVNGKMIIEIHDAIGKLQYYNRIEMLEQVSTIDIHEVADFVPGNYFLTIQNGTEVYNFKLVKVRE